MKTNTKTQKYTPRSDEKTSVFVPLFIFCLIIPSFVHIGSVRLTPYLLILMALFFPCLISWIRGAAGKVNLIDVLVVAATIWQCLALILSADLSRTIEPVGIVLLQFLGAYLVGRTLVRNKAGFVALIRSFGITLMILLPFSVIETLTARNVYLNLFKIIGPVHQESLMEPRLGLDRAQVAFEHPILFGVYCASGFALVLIGLKHVWPTLLRQFASVVVMTTTFLSLSTGALLALTTQMGILCWGFVFRRSEARWKILGACFTCAYVFVDVVSNRTPFHVFVDYMTFNQGTAYNRILIWEYGTASVGKYPFFGLGIFGDDWERPYFMSPSMDNFWLVIAVRYGFPAFFLLAAAFVVLLFRMGLRKQLDEMTSDLRAAAIISLIGVFFAICSVHLWNATMCWLMFLAGSCVWMTNEGSSLKEIKISESKKVHQPHANKSARALRQKRNLSRREDA